MLSNNIPTVVVVTNIIAPYRVDLFTKIKSISEQVRVVVIFCGKSYQDRDWVVKESLPFECEILTPIFIKLGKKKIQLNFNLIYRIIKLRPIGIISSEFSLPTIQSWLASKILRCKFGIWSDGIPHSERNISVIQKFIRSYTLKNSDVVVASCNDAIDNVLSYGACKNKVYLSGLAGDYSGISKLAKLYLKDKVQLRKELGIENRFTFIFVGSLIERKGVLELLFAFEILIKEGFDVNLLILGTGHLESDLHEYIEKSGISYCVSLRGFIHDDVAKYYSAADCFVLPTFDDPFGLVIAEAAAAGLPIITTPYAGASREFVENGKNGYIVDPSDKNQLAFSMKRIVKLSMSNREIMSKISRLKSRNWTIDHSASGFVKAAESLLDVSSRLGINIKDNN